jgi:hypothetical protein
MAQSELCAPSFWQESHLHTPFNSGASDTLGDAGGGLLFISFPYITGSGK